MAGQARSGGLGSVSNLLPAGIVPARSVLAGLGAGLALPAVVRLVGTGARVSGGRWVVPGAGARPGERAA